MCFKSLMVMPSGSDRTSSHVRRRLPSPMITCCEAPTSITDDHLLPAFLSLLVAAVVIMNTIQLTV